jgi:hypothetical protein
MDRAIANRFYRLFVNKCPQGPALQRPLQRKDHWDKHLITSLNKNGSPLGNSTEAIERQGRQYRDNTLSENQK